MDASEMETYVCRQNIDRYQNLLKVATEPARHLEIVKLLAEEEAKMKQLDGKPLTGSS